MRVHSVAFAIVAAFAFISPAKADIWPDHAPQAFAAASSEMVVEPRPIVSYGPMLALAGQEPRTDAFGHALIAEALAPEASTDIAVAELPDVPANASELIARDTLVQVLKAVARAGIRTDDEVLNQAISDYLDSADLVTGSLPRGETMKPYISHEAEDSLLDLTTGSIAPAMPKDVELPHAGLDPAADRSLLLDMPATI